MIGWKTGVAIALLLGLAASSMSLCAQKDGSPQPAPTKPVLERKEATDPESGIHYVRLLLSLASNGDPAKTPVPRFTVQCQDIKGKHQMLWFVSFGGIEDPGFEPPFRPTKTDLFPPRYASVNLKMTFEGYMISKPFIRSWSSLPSGEYRYRNGGSDSPNMESARSFLPFLASLPGLHVIRPNPQTGNPEGVFFPTQSLLDELNKMPICSQ